MTDTDNTTAGRGTDLTRFNAVTHGILSRYTVLPWEDAGEYAALVQTLMDEHAPKGPTETHLVEELAGVLWRKRRLRMAETASHRGALYDRISSMSVSARGALAHIRTRHEPEPVEHAVKASDADTAAELADIDEDETLTRRALELLANGRKDAYKAALAALRKDTRGWWLEQLDADPEELDEDEHAFSPTAADLQHFLEDEVLPIFSKRREQLHHRPLIREQVLAEALPLFRLEKLSRYEVFLDRKLERTLAMLIKLKDLRESTETA